MAMALFARTLLGKLAENGRFPRESRGFRPRRTRDVSAASI
jgi:hypothetical protein